MTRSPSTPSRLNQNGFDVPCPMAAVVGDGEMADFVRTHDWGSTSLGPVESWSQTLLTMVNLVLSSPFPSTLFWGPQFAMIYNDAYRLLLSTKHPGSVGKSAREVWKEAWHIIGPQLDAAFMRGAPTFEENLLIPIYKHGQMQDFYWTYSFLPVHDKGEIAGVLNTSHSTTQEVLATSKLRESEARSSRILESIGDAVIVTDGHARVSRMNAVAEALTGWAIHEAVGRPLAEVFHIVNESTRMQVESPAEKVMRLGAVVGLANHTVLIARDGTEIAIDDSGAPIRDDEGELNGIVLVFRDISKRRAAERERASLAEQLLQVLDATTDAVVSVDRNWRITYMNPRSKEMLAASGDVLGTPLWDSFPKAVYEGSPFVEHYSRAMNERVAAKFEAHYPEPLNIWFELHARPAPDGIVVFSRDVTAQKSAAEALRHTTEALAASEEELRWTVKLSTQNPWTADPEGRVLDCSQRWLELTGISREDALGEGWMQVSHPEDLPQLTQAWKHALLSGTPYDIEHRVRVASGVYRWMRSRAFSRRDDAGRVVKWYGTIEDIDERKQGEEALRRSEERMRLALSATNVIGTWDWDVPNNRIYADRSFALAFGVDPGRAAAGAPWREYLRNIHPEDRDHTEQAIMQSLRAGGEYTPEYRLIQSDGSSRWISAHGHCYLGLDGAALRFPGVVIDITARKQAEVALVQTEKLAAVGRLAASIAHEINNPLESVTNLLFLARTSTSFDDIQQYLDIAERELRRVSAISNQTLRFHKQSTSPKCVTCDDLIGGVVAIHQGRLVNSRIAVEKRKRALKPVMCFEGEIRQVLTNLFSNAIDAMHPSGGRLLVRSREGTNWTTGKKGLVLTVADTGLGMSPQVSKKIFEPFFTTKDIGGTGLGLWISCEIINRHHGSLRVRSSQGAGHSGTVFTIFLPFEAVGR